MDKFSDLNLNEPLDNKIKIYQGDCLEILKNKNINNINCIYFDPPFNSNRNYKLSVTNNIGFNDKLNNTNYEKYIEDRIILLKEKLSNDGSLFFHISSQEQFIPFCILKKYFKFINPIYWKRCRSKNNVKHKLGDCIDVIFWCYNNKKKKFNLVYQNKNENYLKNSFNNTDDRGKYALGHLVTEKTKQGYIYEFEYKDKIYNPKSGWRIKKEELEKLANEDRLHKPIKKKSKLYKKIYLHENPGKPCMNLWDDIHSIAQGSKNKRIYPTEKPIKLLERIIEMTTDKNDLILDPMAGSGVTGEVSLKLNRKCILIDINKDAIDIIKNRLLKFI